MAETKLTITPEEITAFSLTKNEPEWFLQTRLKGLELAKTLDLPFIERVKFHRWNLFQSTIGEGTSMIEELPKVIPTAAGSAKIVQLGAVSYWEEMNAETAMNDVLVMDIFDALEQYPELVKPYYMTKAVPVDEDSLTAYHAAMVNSGVFIYIPKNNTVITDLVTGEPIRTLYSSNNDFFISLPVISKDNKKVAYNESKDKIVIINMYSTDELSQIANKTLKNRRLSEAELNSIGRRK